MVSQQFNMAQPPGYERISSEDEREQEALRDAENANVPESSGLKGN